MEKTLESPLDCKEIKPVNPKRNQPWILIGKTDAEAEAPILWPPDVKSQLIGKDLMLGKIEVKRRWQQRMRWLDIITYSMDMNLSKLQEILEDGGAWHAAVHRVVEISNWTTAKQHTWKKHTCISFHLFCILSFHSDISHTKFSCTEAPETTLTFLIWQLPWTLSDHQWKYSWKTVSYWMPWLAGAKDLDITLLLLLAAVQAQNILMLRSLLFYI